MNQGLFRKAALERLSSPEELDSLMQVTTPKGWLALLSLGGLLLVAVLWGIFGSIPTKVAGQGILVMPGGVLDIMSMTSGQVTAIYADVGDLVENGQTVARLAQPKIIEQIGHARTELKEMRAEYDKVATYGTEDIKMQSEYMKKKRRDLEEAISLGTQRLKWLGEILENRRQLLEQELITRQTYIKTQEEIYTTRLEIEKGHSELKQTLIQEFQIKEQRERELIVRQQKIGQQERLIEALEYDLVESSRVISPHRGRILETTITEGKLVEKGSRLLTLERAEDHRNLEAIIYVSPNEGKRVQPGMRVFVSPSSVRQEESGSMLGVVTQVSDFPATLQGMMRRLQNERLVQALSFGAAPIEINADLISDPNTASGYKWTSGKGPVTTIQSGTLCMAAVTVEEQTPISLVIPLLKRTFLGVGQDRIKEMGQ